MYSLNLNIHTSWAGFRRGKQNSTRKTSLTRPAIQTLDFSNSFLISPSQNHLGRTPAWLLHLSPPFQSWQKLDINKSGWREFYVCSPCLCELFLCFILISGPRVSDCPPLFELFCVLDINSSKGKGILGKDISWAAPRNISISTKSW